MSQTTQVPEYAVVIPAYNEEATIHDVVTRALAFASQVIVVDDGSADKTVEKLQGMPITLIENEHNQGKAASLWHGIQQARKQDIKYIVTLDGDGQHAPEDIPTLLAKAEARPEHIIIGARLADKSAIPAKRYYANRIANFWIAWAAGYPISDTQSGFRVYPNQLFDDMQISTSKQNSFVFESEIIIKAAERGIKCASVAIPAVYAENARPSHFSGVRDITYITRMVASYLFKRGFYPVGLYNSSIKPHLLAGSEEGSDFDGYLTIFISLLVILLTSGISFILAFIFVLLTAMRSRNIAGSKSIVILGKKLRNDLPDYDYIQRLERAKILLEDSAEKKIYLLGGVTGEAEISEAKAGLIYLEHHGVTVDRIYLEESSRNTLENMRQLKTDELITSRRFTLVSNRYHLARAGIMARGFGFDVEECAAEDRYEPGFISTLTLIIEAFHLHWYLAGRVYATITANKRMLSRIR